MKKILAIALLITTTALADFTFNGYQPFSQPVLAVNSTTLYGNTVPELSGNGNVSEEINKQIAKILRRYKSDFRYEYKVYTTLTANNSSFISMLLAIETREVNKEEVSVQFRGITFDVKNGKELKMKDIFVSGYQSALNDIVNDRIKQFGVEPVKSFKGVKSGQEFYMQDNAIILIYNKDEATKFGDGLLFLPFITSRLIGILK